MKKLLVCLICFLMIVSLCSCTRPNGDPPIPPEDEPETDPQPQELLPNPATDFEYEINEGNVTIKAYIGTASKVIIPSTIEQAPVTELGARCFLGNRDIVSVCLPDSITVIGGGAFAYCINLNTVRIPSQVEVIGGGAFEACGIAEVTLPNTLAEVGMRAFADCANLKHITISKDLKYGAEIFACSGLESVHIEEGVETIAPSMFACTNIHEVVLPKSLKTIEMNAFGCCENLESVTLNEGLAVIETYAFAETNITEIIIPQSVTKLDDAVFMGCSNLQKVKFEGNAPNDYVSGLQDMPEYTVYYHEGAEGFTSPEWSGYLTKIW